jgi:hypothetical protein
VSECAWVSGSPTRCGSTDRRSCGGRDGPRAGCEGEPRIGALVYFGLSDPEASRDSLRQYYAFLGEWADRIADSAVRTPEAVGDIARAFADVGVTDLVFDPTVADVDEVDRLADALSDRLHASP